MNLEHHKQTIREYTRLFNAGDFDAITSLFTPDAIIHGVLGQGSLDFALPIWRELHAAFHLTLHIEDLVAEENLVAARFTERGQMTAPFRNMPPTGKPYTLTAME